MEPKGKLKGAEIICESLLREGVEVLFGYPGGAILPFYDALWSYPQLRHILVGLHLLIFLIKGCDGDE